jgi:hypothetical protein
VALRSVRQACTNASMTQRADELMKFVDQDGNLIDVINTASGADTLRQRYQVAERCRHDALKYPMLHASAAHLDAILPGTFERLKAAEPESGCGARKQTIGSITSPAEFPYQKKLSRAAKSPPTASR